MVDVLFRTSSYVAADLTDTVFEIMDVVGGKAIEPGERVLIKPNLLLPAGPDSGITSHPLIVKAVAAYVLEKGARPLVADSPGMGSFHKILHKGGYKDALAGMDVEFKSFRELVRVDIGEPFGVIDIAREAMQADRVINVAKLKTHAQMLLTMGVKNMFGCIVGLKKSEWQLKAGTGRAMFARLLVQIYDVIDPDITIVDGILAMEGEGPGKSGTPRELGLIAGSSNAVALDMTLCKLLGLDPSQLLTHRAAEDLGMVPQNINLNGGFHILDDFVFPKMAALIPGPKILHGFMRRNIVQKPVVNNKTCKLCSECWQYCPVQAITHNIKGIRFDYDTCIRCYCCLEICPHGAIRMKEPLMGRLVRPLFGPSAADEHQSQIAVGKSQDSNPKV